MIASFQIIWLHIDIPIFVLLERSRTYQPMKFVDAVLFRGGIMPFEASHLVSTGSTTYIVVDAIVMRFIL